MWGYSGDIVTLWLFNIAMENRPCIDGLPIKIGDFPWQTVSHNQMVVGCFIGVRQHIWGSPCNQP